MYPFVVKSAVKLIPNMPCIIRFFIDPIGPWTPMGHPVGVWYELLKVGRPCIYFQCRKLSRIDNQHALYHKNLWKPPKGPLPRDPWTQGPPWATPWESDSKFWICFDLVFIFSAENWENWYPTCLISLGSSETLSGHPGGGPGEVPGGRQGHPKATMASPETETTMPT